MKQHRYRPRIKVTRQPAEELLDASNNDKERREPRTAERSDRAWFSRIVAALAVFGVAFNFPVAGGITTAGLIAILLLPCWGQVVRRYGHQKLVLATIPAVTLTGLALYAFKPYENEYFFGGTVSTSAYVACQILCIPVFLWSQKYLSQRSLLCFYGVGLLANSLARLGAVMDNPWKFGLSLPITIVVLVLLLRSNILNVAIALIALAAIGSINDTRSYVAFCAATLAIFLYGRLSRTTEYNNVRLMGKGIFVAIIGYILYQVMSNLLLSGGLGDKLGRRTNEQLDRTGSILDSGRPEWRIATELFTSNPLGYGPGAVPNSRDLVLGARGLEPAGLSVQSDYFSGYIFGGQFKLHSVVSDMWVNFGVVGLAVAIGATAFICWSLACEVSFGKTEALYLFVYLSALWYLFFGPLLTNLPFVCFAVYLALSRKETLFATNPKQLDESPNRGLRTGTHARSSHTAGGVRKSRSWPESVNQ